MTDGDKKATVLHFDTVLSLKLDYIETVDIPEEVKVLMKERDQARGDKDFAKSDELRVQIESLGFEVMDTPEGTKVEKK